MKEQMEKCVFCHAEIPISKAWPILRKEKCRNWTCKGHHGVADEIRYQLMDHKLGPEDNPANPYYTTLAQIAWAKKD